ncbi:DUF3039 domain-containing protein [Prescottella equi]|uniref:DUF3039 domain-containing protein n=1 Tax=Rhodococcus hoagii TaxID=43767 RepID=UPI001C78448E|nr:DUF3039 domain-containing protein [Prescottella equi]BCN51607.1 hypothetical protein RE9416_49080 [Prescottella equi]BCN56627.1 hypothetical protein RE9425_50170 [Prescottella equi]BCN61542.1 hypothetical protein RE9427_49120 [Prescottella equi]BCN86345.1 hypothetical protein RE0356_49860 [Prescottella equi]
MHNLRRARPTLKVLSTLNAGWENPIRQRAVTARNWDALHPFPDLEHPLILKSAETYGDDPANDPAPQHISCARDFRLLKVRSGQWRGAIWEDPESGSRWLVAAGLAKGGHSDRDDVYEQLAAVIDRGRGGELLPTEEDRRLHKLECAAWAMTAWGLAIQGRIRVALVQLGSASSAAFEVPHPRSGELYATVEINCITDDPELEEYVVDIHWPGNQQTSPLAWEMIQRVLTSIAPTAQQWDTADGVYSQYAEVGHRVKRIGELFAAETAKELLAAEPGKVSHYTHRTHIARSTVEGKAVRAMCGVHFVAVQDHHGMPLCPECAALFSLAKKG